MLAPTEITKSISRERMEERADYAILSIQDGSKDAIMTGNPINKYPLSK